ncbi:hypothetical protein ABXT06_17050 [Flavobacterium sp. UW10123]|uniref:hypothetical protein n=1 Tax=Flavobacterium sp. UW10123 TaxID=3230800 RepID=UPI0033974AE2
MNVYDYIFYRMYKSTAKVNDLYPEIPTIIFLSVMIFLNLGSIMLVADDSLEDITLNGIYFIGTVIMFSNFYYFLKNDKYKGIIEEFDSKKRVVLLDILIFIYPFASFFVCFKLLKMPNGPISFTLIGLLLIEIISFFCEKKE